MWQKLVTVVGLSGGTMTDTAGHTPPAVAAALTAVAGLFRGMAVTTLAAPSLLFPLFDNPGLP